MAFAWIPRSSQPGGDEVEMSAGSASIGLFLLASKILYCSCRIISLCIHGSLCVVQAAQSAGGKPLPQARQLCACGARSFGLLWVGSITTRPSQKLQKLRGDGVGARRYPALPILNRLEHRLFRSLGNPLPTPPKDRSWVHKAADTTQARPSTLIHAYNLTPHVSLI